MKKYKITTFLWLSFNIIYLFFAISNKNNIKTENVILQETACQEPITINAQLLSDEQEEAFINKETEKMNREMTDIAAIKDKKEWFIAYKSIVDKYSTILDPPETIYDYFNNEELDLLFHVVQAEVGDEYSFEQKTNVASVIFNRLDSEYFPDGLSDIIFAPEQFQTVSNGRYKAVKVSEDTILACEYAFEIEDTTDGCLFFDSNNVLNYQFIFNDSAHNFYKCKND